jgi:hypothetical protein
MLRDCFAGVFHMQVVGPEHGGQLFLTAVEAPTKTAFKRQPAAPH